MNEKQNNIYEDIDEAIKKAPEKENKRIYLTKLLYILLIMGNIGWTNNYSCTCCFTIWQGKISSIMGDVAKGIKVLKKGCLMTTTNR